MNNSAVTARLAEHLSTWRDWPIPADVVERGRMHLLDGIVAAVSGRPLAAGRSALDWLKVWAPDGTSGSSTIIATGLTAPPWPASLANGMAAHADETDDSHGPSHSHPGCSVIPTVLAIGEEIDAPGQDLIRAVVAGYEIGCRIGRVIRSADEKEIMPSTHSIVGTFCSAASAAALYGLNAAQCQYLLSYAAQLASGSRTYFRDTHHVEKAFVYGGMPASNGILGANLVRAGCNGTPDVFDGPPSWFDFIQSGLDLNILLADLGDRYEITETTIKKHPVASPALAAVDAAENLIATSDLLINEVDRIDVTLLRAETANNRAMPNVNVQYLVAGTLIDGRCSASMAHDVERMSDPEIRRLMSLTHLHMDRHMPPNSALVIVHRGENPPISRYASDLRGSVANPMTWDDLRQKASGLMSEVLGPESTEQVCNLVLAMEGVSARELGALLRVEG